MSKRLRRQSRALENQLGSIGGAETGRRRGARSLKTGNSLLTEGSMRAFFGHKGTDTAIEAARVAMKDKPND